MIYSAQVSTRITGVWHIHYTSVPNVFENYFSLRVIISSWELPRNSTTKNIWKSFCVALRAIDEFLFFFLCTNFTFRVIDLVQRMIIVIAIGKLTTFMWETPVRTRNEFIENSSGKKRDSTTYYYVINKYFACVYNCTIVNTVQQHATLWTVCIRR